MRQLSAAEGMATKQGPGRGGGGRRGPGDRALDEEWFSVRREVRFCECNAGTM